MRKIAIVLAFVLSFSAGVYAADYMSPEEIQRIWGDGTEGEITLPDRIGMPGYMISPTDWMDEYSEAAAFIQSLQYTEPDTNFGGMMEAEHLLDIIQTDNTSEAVWIWCRYKQLTGDDQYYQNIEHAWTYIYNWPAWREEGGSHPSNGYYRYYVGGWGLLAEMIFRETYGSDIHRVYADSVAEYMISNTLSLSTLNAMVYAWAMGCLYQYGLDVGVQEYVDYADSASTAIKEWVDVAPTVRLRLEQWAMAGGAIAWGLQNSYFKLYPDEAFGWYTENMPYMDTIDSIGSWHLAHNAWYALGHWTAFEVTDDSLYYYNHAYLTDTILVRDGDNDGGIPSEFKETDDEDESWCTAYLGFMCLNLLLSPPTSVDDGEENTPNDYVLLKNYPDPFNNRTVIEYSGFPRGEMILNIYDLLGRRVDTIYPGYSKDGHGRIQWRPDGVSSGVYFLRLTSMEESRVIKATLVK